MNDEAKLNSPYADHLLADAGGLQAKLATLDGSERASMKSPDNSLSKVMDTLQQKLHSVTAASQPGTSPGNQLAASGSGGHFVSLGGVAEKLQDRAGQGSDAHERAANALESLHREGVKLRDEKSEPKGQVTHNPAVY